jgi:hypothetical protein
LSRKRYIFTNIIGIDKLVNCPSQKTLFQVCAVITRQEERDMTKRKIATMLVLPFVIFLGLIGWLMCLAGEKKVTHKTKSPNSTFCSS